MMEMTTKARSSGQADTCAWPRKRPRTCTGTCLSSKTWRSMCGLTEAGFSRPMCDCRVVARQCYHEGLLFVCDLSK